MSVLIDVPRRSAVSSRRALALAVVAASVASTAACSEPPQAPTLPVVVAEGGRHLAGENGVPWFGVGDTAWSLVVEPSLPEAELYLEDRAARGVNLVVANVLEAAFASDPPANAAGDEPFVGEAFATPVNEAYWQHLDALVGAAQERGVVLLLCPAYLGFAGNEEGWADEVVAATDTDMRRYGQFLAARYRGFDNVMWLIGHDRVPDQTEKRRMEALADQLPVDQLVALSAAADAGPLGAPPWAPTSIEPDVETVYSYNDDPLDTAAGWEGEPTRPVLFLEGRYEQERDADEGDPQLRRQMYGPFLAGASAVVFGNNPIWNFEANPLWPYEGTWQDNLDSQGSRQLAVFGDVVGRYPWWELTPDVEDELVVGGRGRGSELATARWGSDLALVYVPSSRTVELAVAGRLGSSVQVEWLDPTTGEVTRTEALSSDDDSPVEVDVSGTNAAGDEDWLLVVTPQ